MNRTADVIVIGSGVVGSSCAYELRKRGYDVIVLERSNNVGDGQSSRNGAGVRITGRAGAELDLAKLAILDIWPTLGDELEADLEYDRCGSLNIGESEAQAKSLRASYETMLEQGWHANLLDGDEARKLCPALSEIVTTAVYCEENGVANPMVTTLAYYRKARRMGVRYITGENVISLRKVRGRIRQVICESGNVYEADKVVVAAGFNSRRIAETVGIWIPFLKRVDECEITEPLPPITKLRISVAGAGGAYWHQTRHGSFIFGGNTEIERYELTYDDRARNTNKSMPDKARKGAKWMPVLKDVKVVRYWAGWLDSMVDKHPIIQEIPEVPGLVLSCGYSGHGFAPGPAAGLVTAEVVAGVPTSVDISSLAYDRFKAKMN